MHITYQKSDWQVDVGPGTYYLGDPCYVIDDRRWSELLDSCDTFNKCIGYLDGQPVLGFGTAYGDGIYTGSDHQAYWVDSGMIGLVPERLAVRDSYPKGQLEQMGRWVTFDEETQCKSLRGVLTFGTIVIDTNE